MLICLEKKLKSLFYWNWTISLSKLNIIVIEIVISMQFIINWYSGEKCDINFWPRRNNGRAELSRYSPRGSRRGGTVLTCTAVLYVVVGSAYYITRVMFYLRIYFTNNVPADYLVFCHVIAKIFIRIGVQL